MIESTGLDLQEMWRTVKRPFLLGAFLFYGLGFLTASLRWYWLLEHIQVRLPFLLVLRLAMIGQFFNLFVPGGVGGDVIKAVYLQKEAKDKAAESLLSVVLDRLLGLAGILSLALFSLALSPSFLKKNTGEARAILALVVLSASFCLLGLALFFLWPKLSPHLPIWAKVWQKLPSKIQIVFSKVIQSLAIVRSAPLTLFKLLLCSSAGHFCAGVAVFLIGQAVGGAEALRFQDFLLATQLSNLVGAVPLTPGGVGGRDLTLSYLLSGFGTTGAAKAAIPVVVTLLIVLWSALGGLALLWERNQANQDPPGKGS